MSRLCEFRHLAARMRRLLTAPRPARQPPHQGGSPIVAGFMSTPSGIGESARLCYSALARLKLEPRAVDLSPHFLPHDILRQPPLPAPDTLDGGPLIIHANPPELPAVAAHLGTSLMSGRLVVGYWAWELPDMPATWRWGFSFVHEIWVPSRFTADAIRPHTTKPVRIVPHPLRPAITRADRASFGLPEDAFVALAVCDLRSSLARKNPLGAVEAFVRAFGPDDARHILVLKVGGIEGNRDSFAQLTRAVANIPTVRLLAGHLSTERMDALLASIDVFVSLHRSEGFGLVVAQAMLAGKAVVATGWSGTADFLTEATAVVVPSGLVPVADAQGVYRRGVWAEPDLGAAAAGLARLAADPEARHAMGIAAAAHIRAFCSDSRYAACITDTITTGGR